MRRSLLALAALGGAAAQQTAETDVSISTPLALGAGFDAATFNRDWYARVPLRRALAKLVSSDTVCQKWWQDWESCVSDPVASPSADGHAVDLFVKVRHAGAIDSAEASRRYLTKVRGAVAAGAADGSFAAAVRATAAEVGEALGEAGVEIWNAGATISLDSDKAGPATAVAAAPPRRLAKREALTPASYSFSFSYDLVYDLSYEFSYSYSHALPRRQRAPVAAAAARRRGGGGPPRRRGAAAEQPRRRGAAAPRAATATRRRCGLRNHGPAGTPRPRRRAPTAIR